MGNPKGVRRDFAGLEKRRLWVARLLEKGVIQSQVARQVGVHRQSVSRWAQQLEKEGRPGLKQAGRAGRLRHFRVLGVLGVVLRAAERPRWAFQHYAETLRPGLTALELRRPSDFACAPGCRRRTQS